MSNLLAVEAPTAFEAQQRLLNRVGREKEVKEVLSKVGLSIDRLVYEDSRSIKWCGPEALSLSSFTKVGEDIPIVSFFTGCGGMDLGFEAVGFSQRAAFEFSEIFCNTLRANRPKWKTFGPPNHRGDVSCFQEVVDVLSRYAQIPFEGVFVGGPPCQPFSIAANQRFKKSGPNFKRVGFDHARDGSLLFDYVRLIVEFKPAVFVVENVPGLRDIDGGEQLSQAISILRNEGYEIADCGVYDASRYGVPQTRRRMIVIGTRLSGDWSAPAKTEPIGCGGVLEAPFFPGISNHETRNHKVMSILRYMTLGYGKRERLGRVDRLDPSRPSKTVIAGGSNGGGRSHLHPEIPRTLTVRECARLQSFPDDYVFVGSIARQFTQVGNAVPPVLAAVIATRIAKTYF